MHKKIIYKHFALTLCFSQLVDCGPEFNNQVDDSSSYSSGVVDFLQVVTLGDSLTAGYADGAFYLHGQENSYPAILARQFAEVGGGAFSQPLINDNLGGLFFWHYKT